ncbi:hypothetical protein [Vulgatibacter incomptus]|uniref:Transcription termination factor Rho n=1 Tax=Vulgatibacter incomptus TaxID=1391653 RepID=A0A0K1PI60_9BACT|nr:hypothetical protein [Vulgatibacter incomptus]AKU92794.1 transcription termination factor Rho [Vulgatibacter incomptus]
MGFEAAALEAARGVDKPLLAGDFEAQLPPLEKLASAARKGGKSHSLDELSQDTRGKLFTALLRVMRQRPVEDEEKEAKRRQVFATLAEVWRALGDERRMELAKEEAGDVKIAPWLLAHTGEWDKVAAFHEHERKYREAAKLYEEHDQPKEAARLYGLAGDAPKVVELLGKLGDREALLEEAKKLPPQQQETALLAAGQGDVLMQLLVEAERWEDVGRLYERAEQWGDAARAFEKAGKTHKAARAFDKAGETQEADRLIEVEAKALEESDPAAAAKAWARFGRPLQAARLATSALEKFRWLREGGDNEQAAEIAKAEAAAAVEAGKPPLEIAPWLARSGDTAGALKIYDEHRQPEDAGQIFEELGENELAARCYEVAGKTRKAAELFERAGNAEAAERLRAMEPAPAKAAPKAGPKGGAKAGPRPGGPRRGGGERRQGGRPQPKPKG